MILGDIPKMKRTKQIRWIFHPLFPKLLRVLKADILGSKPRDLSLYHYLKDFLRQKEEKLLPEPQKLITGGEVISKFHLKPGPEIGKILQKVHHAQLDEKIKTKKEALEYVKRLLKNDY
jgi:hypothetical protein